MVNTWKRKKSSVGQWVIALLVLFSFRFHAQQSPQLLKDALSGTHPDSLTQQIEYCVQLTRYYSETNADSMLYFKNLLVGKVSSVKEVQEQIKVFAKVIREEMLIGRYDLSRALAPEVIELCNQTKDYKTLSKIYYYFGYYHQAFKSNTDSAASYYIQSLAISARVNDKVMLAHVNSAIGILYLNNGQCDSASGYIKHSQEFHRQLKDSFNLLLDRFNEGAVLACKGKLEEAEICFKEVLRDSRKKANRAVELNALYNLANVNNRMKRNEQAEREVAELIERAKAYNNPVSILNATTLWAAIKVDGKSYKQAIQKAEEALKMAQKMESSDFISSNLSTLITASKLDGNYQKAYHYLNVKKKFDDSIANIRNTRYLEKLKGEYNLDIKNKELHEKTVMLEQNANDSRNKNSIIVLLLALIIFILVFFYLFKSRKKAQLLLQEQTMLHLQRQQDFKSFINGQETERKRIASDLHDGLAQNLVMLGLRVSGLKIEQEEEKQKKAELQRDINAMINDTRTIAHNMMPDVLTELGVLKALKSLVLKINESNTTLSVKLVYKEPFLALSSGIEIQLYRIIQELLNNIIKHASATEAEVNVSSGVNGVHLKVRDNGKGFDVRQQGKQGIGLKSISSRVHSLGGSINFISEQGKGSETVIYLPPTKE